MPREILSDVHVTINSVDLSDHVKSVNIEDSVDLQEASAMGDAGVTRLAGLRDWSVTLEFFADYDSAKVDATLQPLIGVQTALVVRKSADAKSATNPEYQGNGMLESLPVVSGEVGSVHTQSVTFQGSDGVALIRSV